MNPDPHSRHLRLHRLSDTPATFFITKSLLPKKPALDEAVREIVVSALAFAVGQQRIYLRAFVVMPDHWHALFALRESWTLPKFMHHMMSYVGGKTTALLTNHKTSWQDGYYDTRVKTAKQFQFVTHYIEQNPVVKGLVEKPDEWDASSARRTDLVTDPWPRLLDEH
jgi:REP element-mobilizing transposase RayT